MQNPSTLYPLSIISTQVQRKISISFAMEVKTFLLFVYGYIAIIYDQE